MAHCDRCGREFSLADNICIIGIKNNEAVFCEQCSQKFMEIRIEPGYTSTCDGCNAKMESGDACYYLENPDNGEVLCNFCKLCFDQKKKTTVQKVRDEIEYERYKNSTVITKVLKNVTNTVPPPPNKKSDDCFIATAAYGTSLAEEIQILKDWRDLSLRTTVYGRATIDVYYTISPPIAQYIETKDYARALVRLMLKPLIFSLKNKYT